MKTAYLPAILLLTACAQGIYRTEPLPLEPERGGVVEEVRGVPLSGRAGTIAGSVIGGTAGGTVGSTVGSGRGSQAATVAGTIAGSVAGYALGSTVDQHEGLEITVRLDNGRQLLVVQPAGETFKPGERVRVIAEKQVTRVTH